MIERIQNDSLRIMTRMAKDTPCDFLCLQAGIEPLENRMMKNSRILREKYERLEQSDARRMLANKEVKIRLTTRKGWRWATDDVAKQDLCREIKKETIQPMKPLNIEITEVALEKKKDEYSKEELRRMTETRIAEIDADVEIYTDGSTDGMQRNGGAGVFIQDKEGKVLLERAKPAGRLCSSYDGESVACLEALKWIQENGTVGLKYAIFTDSLSLVTAIKSNSWKDSHEWMCAVKKSLQNIKHKVMLCWVPSHCDTFGNDKADRLADEGAKMPQNNVPVTFNITRAKIKAEKWKPKHERAAKMFGERRKPKEIEKGWKERIKRLYGRLRSDHAEELRAYQKRVGIVSEGICIYCDTDEEETIEHVLCRCPQLECARREMWPAGFTVDMLVTHPDMCRELLGRRYPALRRTANPEEDGGGSQ